MPSIAPSIALGLCDITPIRARNVAKWRGLDELWSPDVCSAVLPRVVPSAVQAAAAALAEAPCFDQDAPELVLSVMDDDEEKLDQLTRWLEGLLPRSKSMQNLRSKLAEDVLWCCSVYDIAHALAAEENGANPRPGHQFRRVTLELADGPGGPRFHIDTLQVRLLRVYFGPTTEVLDKAGVDWEAFEAFRDNEHIVTNPNKVMRMPPGSAMVLKGRHFHPEQERTGCIYRSPSLDAPGWLYNSRGQPRRLLLTIDDMPMGRSS